MLASQALYHFSHADTLSVLIYFSGTVSLFSQASLCCDPPIYASQIVGMIGTYHYTQLYLL
jgi:hypothetical protein